MTRMVQVLVLLALRLSLVGTHRPQQVSSLGLEDTFLAEETEEAEHGQPDEATAEPLKAGSQRVFTAGPGLMGMHVHPGSGKILRVYKGSGAERLGWKAGQKITQVENQDYTFRLYAEIVEASAKHSTLYKITIDTAANETAGTVQWVEWCSGLLAGITGATLVLACPWFIYQIFRFGLDGACKAFSQRVMWLLLVVAAGSGISRFCNYSSSLTLAGLFYAYAIATYEAGILLGYFWNLGNPLLEIALRKDVSRQVLKADTVILVLFGALSCCKVGKAVFISVLTRQTNIGAAIAEPLIALRAIPQEFVGIQFYWMISRICAAARQGMLEVAEALPCDAAEFGERVHKPSANLLQEIPPQLATCGAPLLLLTLSIPGILIWYYDDFWNISFLHTAVLKSWTFSAPQFFQVASGICSMALTPGVVAVGPFWLSSGLKDFKAKLNETRQRDPAMHLQVQAVDVMLVKVNHNNGWGVPVFDGFVLSKSTLQMICIQVVLAGTVIKATLDAEIGLEEEKDQEENSKLDVIRTVLRNMSSVLDNRTFENVSDVISNLQDLILTVKNHTMRLPHL